jgi:hypothetical protein
MSQTGVVDEVTVFFGFTGKVKKIQILTAQVEETIILNWGLFFVFFLFFSILISRESVFSRFKRFQGLDFLKRLKKSSVCR